MPACDENNIVFDYTSKFVRKYGGKLIINKERNEEEVMGKLPSPNLLSASIPKNLTNSMFNR